MLTVKNLGFSHHKCFEQEDATHMNVLLELDDQHEELQDHKAVHRDFYMRVNLMDICD